MYPDLNDYLFTYLFMSFYVTCVQAQTMWTLATSNGVFFFSFFSLCWNIYVSPRKAEKNPIPKFRTITFYDIYFVKVNM
jgi:hypothetical protein